MANDFLYGISPNNLTRLTVHLKDSSKLLEIGRSLASLSAQRNDIGVYLKATKVYLAGERCGQGILSRCPWGKV